MPSERSFRIMKRMVTVQKPTDPEQLQNGSNFYGNFERSVIMKKRKIAAILMTLTMTCGMIFGCSAKIDVPEVSQEETEEPAEEAKEMTEAETEETEEKTEAEEEASADEKEAEAEADEEENSGEIAVKISSLTYETKIENFDGRTDLLEITDDGHEKLKEGVDGWFKKYRSDFEEKCAEFEKDADEERKMIEEESSGQDEEVYMPNYSLDYSISVARSDESMFSVVISEYSFTGGAHGGTYLYGVNFDTKTGQVIENSTFDASADSIKEYIIKCIKASDKKVDDILFPEWEETVDTMFSKGMKDGAFWFNGNGMTYVFQQYDIAPYAAGIQTFDIPYVDMKDFPDEYKVAGTFYAADISSEGFASFLDIDGDGKEEKLFLESETDENTYYSNFTLHIGDKKLEVESDYYYYCEPRFVHSSEGDYFFFTVTSDNDFNRILMYSAEGDFEKIDELDGSFKTIEDGKAVVASRHDAFGTWSVNKDYTYDKKGLHTNEKIDRIDNDPRTKDGATGITLLKDLEYSEKAGDYKDVKTLKKGSVIYPVSDSGTELGFVTEDKKEGFFEYTHEPGEGGRKVDGVPEDEMFEGMPYAG